MRKKFTISSSEWKLVLIITLIVLFLSQLPLLIGYLTEGSDEKFMGIPHHVTDINNHLNWVLQAKEGNFFFSNDFTSEEIPALIFNPFHLIIGSFARITHLSTIFSYNFFGILSIIGFCFTLYFFISYFLKKKNERLLSFLLVLTSAGFGLWWHLSKQLFGKWIVSSDLWLTEMNTFQSFTQPHFTFSLIILLFIFYFAICSIEENNKILAIYSGLLSLLLTTVHLFDVVTLSLVLTGWFAYLCITKKKFLLQPFKKLLIIAMITLPGVIYYVWVFFFNATYKEWNSLNQTITPKIVELVSGFGFIFFLAGLFIYSQRKNYFKQANKIVFLSIWIIMNLILVYLPINVQRRFLLGIHIPIAILATLAITQIIIPYMKKRKKLTSLLTTIIIILLCSATTWFLLITQITSLHETTTGTYGNTKYLSIAEYGALEWIAENTENSDVIIAPLYLSNYIPAITGNKVYCGHWAQTINFEKKCAQVKNFYDGTYSFKEQYYYINMQTFQVIQ